MLEGEYLVALVAAILAGAAFFVAILQVLLQYLSSNNARWKCTKAAIGPSSKYRRSLWSFKSWKMKVYYPRLNFDAANLIKEMAMQDLYQIDGDNYIKQIQKELPYQTVWNHIVPQDVFQLKWTQIA